MLKELPCKVKCCNPEDSVTQHWRKALKENLKHCTSRFSHFKTPSQDRVKKQSLCVLLTLPRNESTNIPVREPRTAQGNDSTKTQLGNQLVYWVYLTRVIKGLLWASTVTPEQLHHQQSLNHPNDDLWEVTSLMTLSVNHLPL